MIDWGLARRLARGVARRAEPSVSDEQLATETEPLSAVVAEIEERIAAVSGLRPTTGSATISLVDRSRWVEANIASFERLLAPITARAGAIVPAFARAVGARVTGTEVGLLLGWMSRRVLGQYDLLLGQEPDEAGGAAPDAVYLVRSNLVTLEQRYGFEPGEFRRWVLIHELTHRAQFTGVPWMREHFSSLVAQALAIANPEPAALVAALRDALRNPGETRVALREHGPLAIVASPEQRVVIGRISGLMSLLEGHGDVTMTRAAGPLVEHAPRFERILQERRKRGNPVTRAVQRLLGIEAKLNQYAAGARFIAEVEAADGPRAIERCWTSPDALPTMDEIREPRRWLARVERAPAP